ncbi:MAG: AAA family ATPase [Clostridiales bacterium]|nr:AAA family ATPase [Clostridiales bacterium]
MIIMFSGKVGSGKTSLSKQLANDLQAEYISFGEYVVHIAKKNDLNHDNRKVLQNIGEEQIRKGWHQFCNGLLNYNTIVDFKLLVVDGMRHIDCYNTFQEMYPGEEIIILYINIDNSVSLQRQKKLDSEINYGKNGLHMTEKEVVTTIPYIADLILDGTKDINTLLNEVKLFISKSNVN